MPPTATPALPAPVRIRPAEPADLPFILALVPRLTAFGPPAWRDAEQMTQFDREVLTRAVHEPTATRQVFVAETTQLAGLLHLTTSTDYYEQTRAHIADLIVDAVAEGQGVGRALLAHAETWARAQGLATLALSVFAQNTHAREVYQKAGFGEDMITCIKQL
ncbi:GNAT family N-acetyltransferase [Hymenobacter ruricola]|uniref:GNAT family N-acetyltransferase n=1 Tax=Hymenobacter ruricola TaxID=2791023 RepID=A0ABS0I3B6_9BACT|nr:GNAT family N-acetyltransferase [Hymenobacter ruricola]MBF9221430.1 GNAT family N-acetyltransferase [Hymenobacter ruricola]